ncbi:46387_t:CDS:2, partial [Gigaspora margarita]
MVANRSDCQVVKHKSGRRHNPEIENALKNQQQLPFKKDGKDQIKDKSQNPEQQAENQDKEIKASQKIGDSEKQIELQKKEERLSKLEKIRSNTTQKPKSDNNFPTGLVIGGGMLALVGLM